MYWNKRIIKMKYIDEGGTLFSIACPCIILIEMETNCKCFVIIRGC